MLLTDRNDAIRCDGAPCEDPTLVLPESMSISPREAAVAATLAGAVVVVLGYASGFGLRVPFIEASVVQPPISVPSAPVEQLLPPTTVILPPAVVSLPAPVARVTPQPSVPAPSIPATPEPTPTQPAPCDPGLLGGLVAPVDSLLSSLLGGGLLGTSNGTTASSTDGLLGGTLGSLLGTCSDGGAGLLKGSAR